ncbi:MAG: protein tyrosine kinase, partial [Chloroflexi bacterium HGW-Chloroflexi-1]
MGRVSESKASLEREITSVEADITRTQDALNAVTDDNQRMRLETSLAQYRSTYSSLLSSYQQIRLAEAQATDNIAIAKPARVPEEPIRPRTMTNTLLAAVVGAMIAVGAVFLIEYLDDTIKTPDDVARVSGLSTLGAIARLKETGGTRQLSEGKSTTAANLAVVMAQTGQRVVLVDTDLRRPVMHKVFGAANNTGLTSALLNGDQVVLDGHLQGTEVENLSLLTSGPIPPNPSELLGSHRMARLVEKLVGQADLVIFDSPPVLAVTDAAVMGRQVDGVLLVVDAGQTREQVVAQAAAELQKTGANLLGVVLNRLDSRRGGYYYYYYYYSEEEGGQRRRSASR